jgi:small subunit ribosomal protein S16
MAVKIRLSRIGKKHVPFFRIIAIDSRKKRDGAYLENLGTYDVLGNKFVQFHEERLNDWVSKGAVLTDSVKKLHRAYKQESTASAKAPVVTPKAKKAQVSEAQESKN